MVQGQDLLLKVGGNAQICPSRQGLCFRCNGFDNCNDLHVGVLVAGIAEAVTEKEEKINYRFFFREINWGEKRKNKTQAR